MEEQESNPNPFASPAVAVEAAAISEFDPNTEMRDFHFGKSLLKWMLVCGISGTPSFFIAFSLADQYAVQATAMALGILTFVGFYVFLESREWTRRKLMDQSLRISVRVGYITRVVISILFPVAMFPDMFCGMFSVSFTSAILGYGFGVPVRLDDDPQAMALMSVAVWFYFTTVVQGVLLNIVLGAYTLIVYALVKLISTSSKR